MKNKHVLSILTVVMLLMLTLIPVNCFAYYEAGAPTPEEAIEQYELGYVLNSPPMRLDVTYHSKTISNAIATHSNAIRAILFLLYDTPEEEYAEALRELLTLCEESFDGDVMKLLFYMQNGIYEPHFSPQEAPQNTYTNDDLEFEFAYRISTGIENDTLQDVLSQLGIPITNTILIKANVFDKITGETVSKKYALFEYESAWFIYTEWND